MDTLHLSTGRLAAGQMQVVQGWRAALTEGGENRPRASTSDCIAAAVHDLLMRAPDPLDVARAAEAGRRDAAVRRTLGGAAVSVYVGAEDAEAYLQLLDAAAAAVEARHEQLLQQALAQGEPRGEALALAQAQLDAEGLPRLGRRIPRGTVARLAIDRWRNRAVRTVVAKATDWSRDHHLQLHRARRDMRKL